MNLPNARLKVLFLPHPLLLREPWLGDLRKAIGTQHELVLFDEEAPWDPQFRDVDVVIDQGGVHSRREMLDSARAVKLWQILGTGFDKFPLAYWQQKKMLVANTPGQFSAIALAECALMFILMLARRWHESQANFRQRLFNTPMGRELEGARLLFIGFGASAQALAERALPFGMRFSAVDIREVAPAERQRFHLEDVGKPIDIDRLLPACDYVSLHLHLNAETHHTLDARRLSLLKPSACVINLARGPLVDHEALYQHLADGRLGGAGLDVFSTEPANPNDPLFQLPDVVVMPHNSGSTDGTSRRRAACAAANLERVAKGLVPFYLIGGVGPSAG